MTETLAEQLIARGKIGRLTVLRIDPNKWVRFAEGEAVLRCVCECGRPVWMEARDLAESESPECLTCTLERKAEANRQRHALWRASHKPIPRARAKTLDPVIETDMERRVMVALTERQATRDEIHLKLNVRRVTIHEVMATLHAKRLIVVTRYAKVGRGGYPARYGVSSKGRAALAAAPVPAAVEVVAA